MRQIGNRVLWASGDSTTRILPIARSENTFTIRFEKPAPLDYDSLVAITSYELSQIGIHDFIAEIKGCGNEDVYLSFAMFGGQDTITPCLGRTVSNRCYEISVTLTGKKTGIKNIAIPVILIALLASSFLLNYLRRKREPKNDSFDTLEVCTATRIGSFEFHENKSHLILEDKTIPLSDKENVLLSILLKNLHQPVTREDLMSEIWGSNGVVVLSRNIDVLVSKLRKKLADDPSIKISNVHGVGYKLEVI